MQLHHGFLCYCYCHHSTITVIINITINNCLHYCFCHHRYCLHRYSHHEHVIIISVIMNCIVFIMVGIIIIIVMLKPNKRKQLYVVWDIQQRLVWFAHYVDHNQQKQYTHMHTCIYNYTTVGQYSLTQILLVQFYNIFGSNHMWELSKCILQMKCTVFFLCLFVFFRVFLNGDNWY